MMKTMIRLIVIAILMLVAAPAWSDTANQYFHCQLLDDADEDQLEAVASKWLKAARGMEGGENLEAYLYFPVVAQMGEHDFFFVIVASSLADWGAFQAAYPGSPADEIDGEFHELADCPDSSLWDAVKVE